ncbi:hypothetical protein [Pseudomonas sp. SW-3]|uniref:hypothetical protein n=1 Tax=Pseudomonas sp. SW-3 TaxID=147212 RepID=UPI00190911B9|nr:hypothetical protein [Pseudomonas sp. SW-3]QQN98433.1 hypothetical protein JIO00_26850 [Pseudomonas sp. SW-3]
MVNTDKAHTSKHYPLAHHAGCKTLHNRDNYTTHRYYKVAADTLLDLERWARIAALNPLRHYQMCSPKEPSSIKPKAIDQRIARDIEQALEGKYLELTPWEMQFFEGLRESLQKDNPLTPRQRIFVIKTLNRLMGIAQR